MNYTGDLSRYVLESLFDNLTDKSYWNVDERNNVDMLRIITRETMSKFQLTIGVFSIAFVISVIEKFTEFLSTLTVQYELRYKLWINAVKWFYLCLIVFVDYSTSRIYITLLFEKLSCAAEI